SAIRGEFGSTGRYYERAIAVADRLSDPFSIIFTAAMHGWITFLMGEWDQARGECGRAVAMARQASMPWAASYALLHRGQLCLAEGKWVEASSHLEEACAHARRGDDIQALLPVLAWAHLELGELARASDILAQAIRRTRPEGLRLALAEALRVQAMLAIRLEQWEEA